MLGESKVAQQESTTRRISRGVWFVALLLISGSFCLTLVQLSKGLHEQVIANKEALLEARKQLLQLAVEKETLIEQQHLERNKLQKVRDKSSIVSTELLEQRKRVRLLQYEILSARNDLKGITANCSESTQLMEKQFNVTMRYLLDRVVNNREYHLLIAKNLKDRVVLERSIVLLQNKIFDLSDKLGKAKENLVRAGKGLTTCKADNEELSSKLLESNEALSKSTKLLELRGEPLAQT